MRPAALTKRACLVGRAAEALEGMLSDNHIELEPLAAVLADGVAIDWAFMDPDAASFASAIRPHAGQVVWVGDLPDDSEDVDAVFDGSVEDDALTRWLLAHTELPAAEEAAGD